MPKQTGLKVKYLVLLPSALTAVEDKIPSVSNLAIKNWLKHKKIEKKVAN